MSQSHRFIFRAPDRDARLQPLQVGTQDIAAWLLDRDPQAIVAFDSISKDEYSRAFAVARTMNADVINDLYYALVDTFDGNGTVKDFQDKLIPTLKEKGWLGGSEGEIANRLALIYKTNAYRAMADFDYTNAIKNAPLIPYRMAVTAEDERVRHPPKSASDHRAWDGIFLPITHPFWAKWGTRHIGFGCRCNSIAFTRSQMARRGLSITSDDDLAKREERLGQPVFASPGASIAAKVSAITARSNDGERMPGVDPIDTGDVIDQGQRMATLANEAAAHLATKASLDAAGLTVPGKTPSRFATMTADEIAAELAQGNDRTFSAGLSPETAMTIALLRARRRLREKR